MKQFLNPSGRKILRGAMCVGKRQYSKIEAQTQKNYREKQGSGKLRIYECPICNFWHLTHKT